MSNKILAIIFVSSLLILGACSSDKDNVDLSEASSIDEDTVTSGGVSDAYYDSMVTIMVEYTKLLDAVTKQLENSSKVKSDAEEYLTMAITERVEPSTSEEYDIDEYFFKFLSNSKSSAEYFIKYANEGDSFYLDLANDYKNDAFEDIDVTESILNKYGYE